MSLVNVAAPHRLDRLDAVRGVAMLWMAAFHFSFDLNHFGVIERQDFYRDPFWTLQRVAIVSLFLLCAGIGQAAALGEGRPTWDRRFWRRWALIAGCAALVSLGSWFMFPRSWISFGVLHGIAVMLLLVRFLAPLNRGLWWVGAIALALPWLIQHAAFDNRWLNGVGLVTRKPITEDFVPVLPWLGVMCWGLAAGRWVLRQRVAWLAGPVPLGGVGRGLATLGRWPLSFYMLHQPVLIGLVLGGVFLRRVAG